MLGEKLRFVIICIVTGVWAINFFAGLFVTNYEPDPNLNTVFMTIVGSLFVVGEVTKKLGQKAEEKKDDKGKSDTGESGEQK